MVVVSKPVGRSKLMRCAVLAFVVLPVALLAACADQPPPPPEPAPYVAPPPPPPAPMVPPARG